MNEKRKVLFLRSNPVDPDPRVEKEANELIKAGFSVDILCWDRQADYGLCKSRKELNDGSCDVYRAGIAASFGGGFRKNLKPLLKYQKTIRAFLSDNGSNYDVVHACDFDTALSGYTGTRRKKTKFIYDIFDYYADAFSVPKVLRGLIVALDTHVINRADGVIICSEQRRKQLGKARPKRLAVIHNAPAEQSFDAGERADTGRMRIAYVGILSDGRLIPELLETVSLHGKEYELHIAGFGKLESLVQEYADRFDNIVFYGRTDYSRTLEIENEADVLTAIYDPNVANHKYAAPNKFYEALMLGKPLVMCRNTGMSEVVEENGIGVCIDYSGESLAEGLEKIHNRIPEYRAESSSEREIYREQYSWETMRRRLLHLYDQVLGHE